MKITHYSFGKITIDGKTYTSDVIIYPAGAGRPGRVDASWWRRQGHRLEPADLADIVNAKPDVLIIGTGAYGEMWVPEETVKHFESRGIEVKIDTTENAVGLYNAAPKDKAVAAAFHLTC